jgi:Zn-finger nucleic acid-binding protein
MLECATCDGIWIDADVFEALCASSESQSAVLHRLGTRTPVAADARVKYRKCLRCGTVMNRVNFGRLSGTIIDVCRGHGTFLDAGELHAVLAFIRAGGLDRARDRQIEDLRDEQRRLRDQQATEMRRSRDTDTLGSSHVLRWSAGDLEEILRALGVRK